MKMRKTVSVESIKNRVNDMLLNSADCDRGARESMHVFLENVLMETGNYKGFRYLIEEDMAKSEYGIIPGRHFTTDGDLSYDQQFANTDCTRVQYF
jgi:hypothetical protein